MRPPSVLITAGVAQVIDDFLHFFFGFVAAGDVSKGDGVLFLIQHTRAALAEAERPALAAALHLTHEEHPHANQQQHREPEMKIFINSDGSSSGLAEKRHCLLISWLTSCGSGA